MISPSLCHQALQGRQFHMLVYRNVCPYMERIFVERDALITIEIGAALAYSAKVVHLDVVGLYQD